MNTNYDPFQKHRQLIEYLMVGHMSSFSVNGHLVSILGSSEVLLKEVAGPLTEDQKHYLSIINHNTRYLHKHINTFITASRLIFKPQQLYFTKFNPSELLDSFIKGITRNTDIQIEKEIPVNSMAIEGDANLIEFAFASIEELVKQIHPTGKGNIKIIIRDDRDLLKFIVSTNKEMFIDPAEENTELFIIKAVTELHGGTFDIEYDSGKCNMTFALPKKQ